eukprot:GHVT01070188.1.p1 GENE.GHVT01070188.1~~GHVT01070188.1.p1  ORF type:complete len:102 (+),score=22.73 GHVT01070188.1:1247-1552(+)
MHLYSGAYLMNQTPAAGSAATISMMGSSGRLRKSSASFPGPNKNFSTVAASHAAAASAALGTCNHPAGTSIVTLPGRQEAQKGTHQLHVRKLLSGSRRQAR